jgi:hypothetical protein
VLCSRKTDSCILDSINRTNCKKCRLRKCLEVGMLPEKVEGRSTVKPGNCLSRVSHSSTNEEEDEVDEVTRQECNISSESSPQRCPETGDTEDGLNIERMMEESDFTLASLGTPSSSESLDISPTLHLTLEEEFKIHELMIRKEFLTDAMIQIFCEIPDFEENVFIFITSEINQRPLEHSVRMTTLRDKNLESGGRIRACLDMFDEYKNVGEEVKFEMFQFSMSILFLCGR